MAGDRWGDQGPPAEAYSRVTNPERFAPLHEIALELLQILERKFDVDRVEGYDLDPYLETAIVAVVRPTIKLTPRRTNRAAITIAFSTFPGLNVRFGRWFTRPFPICGCDACDESVEDESDSLHWLAECVIAGQFIEEIRIQEPGSASMHIEIWSKDGSRQSGGFGSKMDWEEAKEILGHDQKAVFQWEPWPKRIS